MFAPTLRVCFLSFAIPLLAIGCGTTKMTKATDQLLLSDAVERAIGTIDFRKLKHQRVYLDFQYVEKQKSLGLVNADYIKSALRHQMMACGLRLQETQKEADYIVEVRLGALGANDHTLSFGIPESRNLSSAASLVSNSAVMPTLPEISLARRNDRQGAAKLIAFAYNRQSKRPVWESKVALARSTAQDTWLFGAGPFQKGTVYDGVQFAGMKIPSIIPTMGNPTEEVVSFPKSESKRFMVTDERDDQMGPDRKVQPATVVTPVKKE